MENELERRKLYEILEQYKEILEDLDLVIKTLPKKYSSNPELLNSLLVQYKNKKRVMLEGLNKPYFARIDFKGDEQDLEDICYIGKVGVLDFDNNIVTVDWRAPIASLYYDSNLGPVSYQAPEGLIKGNLNLKRQYEIENGQLLSFNDVDIVANDEMLRPYLGVSADHRLKNIVSSIQYEQNEIIREVMRKNIIVQGVAGSGKTTVALHRIAYLVYNYRNKIKSSQYMVIGPNKFFINYIASVLPDLDVTEVPQLTYEEFAKEYLGEDFNVVSSKIADGKFNINKFKMSLEYKEVIDKYVFYLEKKSVIPSKDFCIKTFNILGQKFIKDIYQSIDSTYTSNVEAKIERTILLVSKYLKDNKEKVYSVLSDQYYSQLEQVKTDKDKKQLTNAFNQVKKELDSSGCVSSLRKYFTFKKKKTTAIYNEMIHNIGDIIQKENAVDIKNNFPKQKLDFAFEDLAGLIYLHFKLHGSEEYKNYRQTVIDEAQDYGTFNFYALKLVLSSSTFSIFGDLAQSIYDYRSIDNWENVVDDCFDGNCQLNYLLKSYRTTVEIMNSANEVLKYIGLKTAMPVIRHGEDVRCLKIENDFYDIIVDRVNEFKKNNHSSIALISRTDEEAKEIAVNLNALGLPVRDINDDSNDFTDGVCSVSSELSKGLEFDAVIITDASEEKYSSQNNTDMKNLYVSMTRPLHELEILYTGVPTQPIKNVVEKVLKKV